MLVLKVDRMVTIVALLANSQMSANPIIRHRYAVTEPSMSRKAATAICFHLAKVNSRIDLRVSYSE